MPPKEKTLIGNMDGGLYVTIILVMKQRRKFVKLLQWQLIITSFRKESGGGGATTLCTKSVSHLKHGKREIRCRSCIMHNQLDLEGEGLVRINLLLD